MQRFGKFSIRFIVALLCSVILTVGIFCCFNRAKEVKAEPITVGLTLGAVVMAFLAASGVAISSSGIDENNLDSSLSTMLSGYEKSDLTYEDWLMNIGDYDGLDWLIGRENKVGAVSIGYELMDWLSGLPSWLIGTYGLSSSGSSTIVSGAENYYFENDFYPWIGGALGATFNTNSIYMMPVDLGTQRLRFGNDILNLNTEIETYIDQYNYTRYRINWTYQMNNSSVVNGSKTNIRNLDLNGHKLFCGINNSGTNVYVNFFVLSVGSGNSVLYSPAFYVQIPSYTYNSTNIAQTGGLTGTIDDDYYQDYQNAVLPDINAQTGNDDAVGVIDLGAGVAEGALTQEQLIQNILDAVYANELDSTWTGVYEDQKTAEDDTDSEKVPTEAEMQGNMVIIDGLEDFFPFCIPFDLYEIISILNVPPETPEFTYTISFGSLFNSEDIDIDFHAFDGVAQVFRIMILIGFIVFLIIKTRDLIRG